MLTCAINSTIQHCERYNTDVLIILPDEVDYRNRLQIDAKEVFVKTKNVVVGLTLFPTIFWKFPDDFWK